MVIPCSHRGALKPALNATGEGVLTVCLELNQTCPVSSVMNDPLAISISRPSAAARGAFGPARTCKVGMMLVAHRISARPEQVQATHLARVAGVARFAYNWALAEWQRQYAAHKAEAALPAPSQLSLRRQLNAIKREQFPWMLEVTKNAPQMAIIQLGSRLRELFCQTRTAPYFPAARASDDRFTPLVCQHHGRRTRPVPCLPPKIKARSGSTWACRRWLRLHRRSGEGSEGAAHAAGAPAPARARPVAQGEGFAQPGQGEIKTRPAARAHRQTPGATRCTS